MASSKRGLAASKHASAEPSASTPPAHEVNQSLGSSIHAASPSSPLANSPCAAVPATPLILQPSSTSTTTTTTTTPPSLALPPPPPAPAAAAAAAAAETSPELRETMTPAQWPVKGKGKDPVEGATRVPGDGEGPETAAGPAALPKTLAEQLKAVKKELALVQKKNSGQKGKIDELTKSMAEVRKAKDETSAKLREVLKEKRRSQLPATAEAVASTNTTSAGPQTTTTIDNDFTASITSENIAKLETALVETQKELKKSLQDQENDKGLIDNLERDLETRDAALELTQQKSQSLEDEVKKLQEDYAALKSTSGDEVKKFEEEYAELKSTQQVDFERFQAEYTELDVANKRLHEDYKQLEEEHKKLRSSSATRFHQLQKQKLVIEAASADTSDELEKLKEAQTALRSRHGALESDSATKIKRLEKELAQLGFANTTEQAKLKSTITTLELAMSRDIDARVKEATDKLYNDGQARDEIERKLNVELEEEKRKLKVKTQEFNSLNKTCNELKIQIEDPQRGFNKQIDDMKAELKQKEALHQSSKKAKEQLQKDFDNLKAESKAQVTALNDAKTQASQEANKRARIAEELATQSVALAEAHQEIENLQQECEELQQQANEGAHLKAGIEDLMEQDHSGGESLAQLTEQYDSKSDNGDQPVLFSIANAATQTGTPESIEKPSQVLSKELLTDPWTWSEIVPQTADTAIVEHPARKAPFAPTDVATQTSPILSKAPYDEVARDWTTRMLTKYDLWTILPLLMIFMMYCVALHQVGGTNSRTPAPAADVSLVVVDRYGNRIETGWSPSHLQLFRRLFGLDWRPYG